MFGNTNFLKWVILPPVAALIFSFTASAADREAGLPAKTVSAGSNWVVDKTTHLNSLSVAEGATITAPQGHSLTMTVDGVETPVRAGTYKGNVVLTPAQDIDVTFDGMGTKQTYAYRVGVYVDNGAYVPEKSVPAAVVGGSVTDASAETVKLASVGEKFNGIVVTGNSTYAIKNPTIRLTGNGKNDFNGVGAAIRAGGSSKVTIENANIKDTGAVRTAIWVGDDSVTTINNSEIEVNDGTLPKDYGWSWVKGGGGGSGDVMMEVPWMLGLRGNNRATLVVGNGTAYYNNTHVKAQSWGAMSTDAVREAKLYLTKCHVETVQHGYGAYADGNSLVHSSGTTFDVADYGLIMSGGSGVFTDGSVVNSRRIGVMAHGGDRGTLTIDKGSIFNTEKAVIQLKSSSPTIVVDNAKLNSKSGIILQVMANDDPNRSGPGGGMGPGGPPGGGPGGPPEGGKYSTSDGNSDVDATFRNVTLQGDFVNSWTAKSGMNLTFENSTVTGAITTATAVHATGPKGEKLVMQDPPDLYYLIGEQTETYAPTDSPNGANVSLHAGSKWVVNKTSYLTGLTVAEGATIAAPKGYSVTLTVDGVETGIKPGTYKGAIALTLTEANVVNFSDSLIHNFRQALYLDKTGVVTAKSVLPAAGSYALSNDTLTGAKITSVGENFNGIYVAGGTYTVKGTTIDLTGNGGNDFAGYGAAVMSTGKDTTLVVDGTKINTHGAVRTAVVADKGSNLIVKNSDIQTKNGKLPGDYVSNVTPGEMKEVPWMLGLTGNCRATNLLGDNTTATYINSSISAEGWGVLSIDNSRNTKLTAINSKIAITGRSGYGSYSIGDAVNSFYGSDIKVGDYAVIITDGHAVFGASTHETVARLTADLKLGLTADEMASLTPAQTTVKSGRFGVMLWGNGSVKITDGTVFDTGKSIFLIKGASANINVDGAKGAQLNSKNGVIIQVIDNDDPGPVMVSGTMVNKGVYHEPSEAPGKAKGFDITTSNSSDVVAAFSNIALKGDFYNGTGGGNISKPGGMPGGAPVGPGGPGGPGGPAGGPGMPGGPPAPGRNLVLKFEKAGITGVISASTAKHSKDTITSADYLLLGEVTNTPGSAVNNGVIVSLTNSTWTVTGTSYLTGLTIADGSTIIAPKGFSVTLTVDGRRTAMKTGTYKGKIELQVAAGA